MGNTNFRGDTKSTLSATNVSCTVSGFGQGRKSVPAEREKKTSGTN